MVVAPLPLQCLLTIFLPSVFLCTSSVPFLRGILQQASYLSEEKVVMTWVEGALRRYLVLFPSGERKAVPADARKVAWSPFLDSESCLNMTGVPNTHLALFTAASVCVHLVP